MMNIQKVSQYIEDKVRTLGYEIEEITIKQFKNQTIIKVVIDKLDRFISIGDCSYVSKNIESFLEEMIPGRFIIEVSSPGADRPLRKDFDFERFKGMNVEVLTKDGKRFVGKLMGKIEGKIYIALSEKTKDIKKQKILDFSIDNIRIVKLSPEF